MKLINEIQKLVEKLKPAVLIDDEDQRDEAFDILKSAGQKPKYDDEDDKKKAIITVKNAKDAMEALEDHSIKATFAR